MAEAKPTFAKTTETAPRGRVSRWWLGGPLLAGALVVSGNLGWTAWKDHLFEKERTETPPHVVEDLKLKLLWIPAGTFTMGTEDEAGWLKSLKKKYNEVKPSGWSEWKEKVVNSEETPATVVTLTKGFYLGETEVTQAQWEGVMGSNPSHFKGANRPVEMVSWNDCVEFCKKLTERERAAGRLGATQVFRLPTEAEWEYACRAGSLGDFCFGNDVSRLVEFAWCGGHSGDKPLEVGLKLGNAWGLYDMHGNASEWCSDAYLDYHGMRLTDPVGTQNPGFRTVRGGCWMNNALDSRSASRSSNNSDWRYTGWGFRLALSPDL